MKALVTGSSGHLGEALVRTLTSHGHDVTGLDIIPGAATTEIGSICDASCVARVMVGAEAVFHAATLHKPHVATHSIQDFIDTKGYHAASFTDEPYPVEPRLAAAAKTAE